MTLAAAGAAVLVLGGCGGAEEAGDDEAASEGASAATSTEADVTVTLGEWVVDPEPVSIAAGSVSFLADNGGGETHELVIVRAADPSELPTDDDGAVDEAQIAEEDFVGEIEELESGAQREDTFDLEAGTYVLFCNITETEDGEVESHFAEGMSSTFTVE
jgi:uncharacterized cupredoxin-like copper-binding protein